MGLAVRRGSFSKTFFDLLVQSIYESFNVEKSTSI